MASIRRWGNRYQVRWRNADGKEVSESFTTQAAAEEAARKVQGRTLLDGRAPDVIDPNALTLTRWWDRWEPGRPWARSSRSTHATHWNKYIKPVFGRMPIEAITTADVSRFDRKLEDKGLAPNTVAAIHRTLSMALQGAVNDGLLARNAARYARLRRVPKDPPVALDAATVAAMLAAIAKTAPGLAVYAQLIAATGLRRSEAAGITWDRIDLDAGTLTVDRQLDYSAPTQPAWAPTKTAKARRVLLTDSLVTALKAHRKAQTVAVLDGSGLVFTRAKGTPWPRSTLQESWNRAADKLEEAGTPLWSCHDLVDTWL